MKYFDILRGFILKIKSRRISCAGLQFVDRNVRVIANRGVIKIGSRSRLKENSRILATAGGEIQIGANFGLNRNSIIVAREKIIIGDNCSIGPNVAIYDHNHIFDKNGVKKAEYRTAPVIIGNNVWIGANVVILKGSSIGDGTVVGAGSIICSDIPAHVIVTSSRALSIREINERKLD